MDWDKHQDEFQDLETLVVVGMTNNFEKIKTIPDTKLRSDKIVFVCELISFHLQLVQAHFSIEC